MLWRKRKLVLFILGCSCITKKRIFSDLGRKSRRSYSPEFGEGEDECPPFSCLFPALRLGAEILLLLSKMYRVGIKGWVIA